MSANALSLDKDEILLSSTALKKKEKNISIVLADTIFSTCLQTFCQTSQVFKALGIKSLKTLWEKENMLITSFFSFSHNVFTLSCKNSPIRATFTLTSVVFELSQAIFFFFF